jgi:hypothetical protein
VGYYAWSEDETYPMAAVLRMPCSAFPEFVAGRVTGLVVHPSGAQCKVYLHT